MGAYGLVAADLDRDRIADLAVVNATGTITILKGGDGKELARHGDYTAGVTH